MVRETFVLNQMKAVHKVNYPDNGGFPRISLFYPNSFPGNAVYPHNNPNRMPPITHLPGICAPRMS